MNKMNKTIIRIILIFLILVWMGIVFYYSSQNSGKSSGLSLKISRAITKDENQAKKVEPYIRKDAHLSEYIVGGMLFIGLFLTFDIKESYKILSSILCGVLYAISDETHQLFVPGRAGQVQDVLIDSIGVCLGVFGLMLVIEIIKRKRKTNV